MDDKKILYANSAEVRSSFYDLIFSFSTKMPLPDGRPEIRDGADIVMSPQHAKTFLFILQNHIRKYEDTFGKIELPEDLLKQFTSKKQVM